MRIHIGESDKWHGKRYMKPLWNCYGRKNSPAQLYFAAWADSVHRSVYHTDKILRLSQDLPIVVEVVESTERIEQILPQLDEMVEGGLITLEKVRVILYRAAKK